MASIARTPHLLAAMATQFLLVGTVAAADVDNIPATVERDIQSYVVDADGSWRMTRELAVRINAESAIATEAQQSVAYNKTLDTLHVLEAYTEKADGRKIAVRPDRIREQEQSYSADVAMFLDQRIKTVILRDYAAFGAAYEAGAAGRAAVTPKIAELARSIVSNARTKRAKALALSAWVRKNIRYAGLYVGAGGIVPHAAADVLEHRYGDCKDHAILLEALLGAVGIDSTQALINSDNAFSLLKVPAYGVINHVINYIPSLDLYLDSTASKVSAGYLPEGDLGKPTVLTKTGQIGRTPATQTNTTAIAADIAIDSGGAATVVYSDIAQGAAAEPARLLWRTATGKKRNPGVTNDTVAADSAGIQNDSASEFRTRRTQHRKALYSKIANGHSELRFDESLIQAKFSTAYMMAATAPAGLARPCGSENLNEHLRVTLPPGVRLVELPEAVSVRASGLDYTSRYSIDGDVLVIDRHYASHYPRAVCKDADNKALVDNYETIMMDSMAVFKFKKI